MNKALYIFITFFLGVGTVFAWVAPVSEFNTPPPLTNTTVQGQTAAYTSTIELTYDPNDTGIPAGPKTYTETNCLGTTCTTRSGVYDINQFSNYGATCDTAASRAGLTNSTYTCSVNNEYFGWTCAATYTTGDPCFVGYGDTIAGGGYYRGGSFKERYVTEVFAGAKTGSSPCKPFPTEWNTQAPYYPDFTYLPNSTDSAIRTTSCTTKAHAGTVQVPVATLAANPSSITSGGSSSLSYSCTNGATSASINNGVGTLSNSDSGVVSVTPPSTTTYTLTCSNSAGSATAQATVSVTALQPDLTASLANPPATTVGTPVTLQATISNTGAATTGTGFTDLFQRATDAAGTGATDIGTYANAVLANGANNPATLSYTFPSAGTWYIRVCADKSSAANTGVIAESNENNNCAGAGGATWTPITVSPAVPPAPTCTFSASPSATVPSTLTWSSTNATSCTGGGFGTGNATAGSASVSTAGTYTLTCTGAGGSCTQSLSVGGSCSGTRTGTVTASPNRVRSGVSTPVTFSLSAIQNVQTSCVLSGPGVSQTFTANSCTVSGTTYTANLNLTTQGIYTLTCDGVKTATTIVNVIPNFTEF